MFYISFCFYRDEQHTNGDDEEHKCLKNEVQFSSKSSVIYHVFIKPECNRTEKIKSQHNQLRKEECQTDTFHNYRKSVFIIQIGDDVLHPERHRKNHYDKINLRFDKNKVFEF